MSGRRRRPPRPPLSKQDKGKAPLQNLSTDQLFSKDPHDQRLILSIGPAPINPRFCYLLLGPKEGRLTPKTLNSDEANPINPVLCLGNNPVESVVVYDCPKFLHLDQVSYSSSFMVFDENSRKYDMVISHRKVGELIEIAFNEEWGNFVRDHNLKAGDEISFYRNLDSDVSDDFYYILKYFRKSCAGTGSSKDDGEQRKLKTSVLSKRKPTSVLSKRNPVFNVTYHQIRLLEITSTDQGPGSRPFPYEASCLSKILKTIEVLPNDAKLYFDRYDVIMLTDRPKIADLPDEFSTDLLVFDGDNRQYTMNLARVAGRRWYCVDTGWEEFLSNHKLKHGDEITFYKFLDTSFHYNYYYVVKCFPKRPAGVVRVKNKPSVSDAGRKGKQKVSAVEVSKENRKRERPGSRSLRADQYKLFKTLTPLDVAKENPKLYIDPTDAGYLTGAPPGKHITKNLVVYDTNDNRYEMLFSQFVNETGQLICTLNGGWRNFVEVHNLEAGDEVNFYLINENSEHHYVIKLRKNPSDLIADCKDRSKRRG